MVEDNQIKAQVSPFAIREGEIKTFDGKDGYVSMNQIVHKIRYHTQSTTGQSHSSYESIKRHLSEQIELEMMQVAKLWVYDPEVIIHSSVLVARVIK